MTYQPPPYSPGPQQPPHGQPYGAPPPGYPIQPPPKKSKTLKVVLFTLLGVLVLCVGVSIIGAVAGGDSDPDEPLAEVIGSQGAKAPAKGATQAKPDQEGFSLKPGTAVKVSQDDAVLEVTATTVKGYKKGCNSFAPEPDNGMYVVVDVSVKVVKGPADISSALFNWVAENGTTSDAFDGLFSGCEKAGLDSSNSVRTGQKRSGQLTFDAPSTKGELEFAAGIFGDAEVSWKFA